jgi:hypothetical protein
MQGQTSPDQGGKTVTAPLLDGQADASDALPAHTSPAAESEVSASAGERTRSRTRPKPTVRSAVGPWIRAHVWQLATATVAACLVAAVAVAAHLWDVSEQWEERSSELTELNYGLADDLTAEQVTVLTQAQQIELLEDQRSTLQTRVLDLADAVSQSGDSAATAEQQISLLTELITTASSVTNGLNRCIDSQEQLATYLETPEDYEPEELDAFADSVEQLCAAATAANFQFQQQLTP